MTSESPTIKKLGVRLKPPAVVAIYEAFSGKLHKRTMPVRGLFKNSGVKRIAEEMKEHHQIVLGSVPLVRIEKLLRIIQENMKGKTLEESLEVVQKDFSVNPEEDLNKLDDETLDRKKELMNTSFELNRKKPGDPDFQYDIEVDFDLEGQIETSGWDSDKDDDFGF